MKFIFALTLFLIAFKTKAQDLTLDQLLLLSGKNQEAVDIYLGTRGWEQAPATDAAKYTWAYGRQKALFNEDLLNPKYKAVAWFHIISLHGLPTIAYDMLSSAKYQILKQRAIALGFKRTNYTEDADGSNSSYSNGKFNFYIHITFNSDRFFSGKNSYEIAVTKLK